MWSIDALSYDVVLLWFSVFYPDIENILVMAAEGLRSRLAASTHPVIMVGSQCTKDGPILEHSLGESQRVPRGRIERLSEQFRVPYLEVKPGTGSFELLTRIVAQFPELTNTPATLYHLSNDSEPISLDYGKMRPFLASTNVVAQIGFIGTFTA